MARKSPTQSLKAILKEFEHLEEKLEELVEKAAKDKKKELKAKLKKVKGVKSATRILCNLGSRRVFN